MADFDWKDIIAHASGPQGSGPATLANGTPMYLASNDAMNGVGDQTPPPIAMPPPRDQKLPLAKHKAIQEEEDDGDDTPMPQAVTQAAASPAPAPGMDHSLDQYRVTPEMYQKAADAKRRDIALGALGDSIANRQSIGNFMTGHMAPHQDVSSSFNKLAELEDSPIKAQQALMQQAMQAPQNTLDRYKAQLDTQRLANYQNAQSKESLVGQSTLSRMNTTHHLGLNDNEISQMNAAQIGDYMNSPGVKDIMETDKNARAFSQQWALAGRKIEAGNSRFNKGQDNKENADWEKFATTINNPSSRAQIGKYQNNIDKANALKTMERGLGMPPGEVAPEHETREQKIARYNRANPSDVYEVAKASDQLISNAGSTIYGTEHLMPKDMGIAGATLGQWVHNGAVPANSGEFIDKFMHMADRESKFYQDSRDRAVGKVAAGFRHLKERDNDRWNEILGSTSDGGQGAPAAAQPSGESPSAQGFEPDVIKYSKDHGITPEQAQAIKTKRTSQVAGGR